MITKVCARNFRSIGERIELELGAMTVLVGPNASGKSNVVDILRFLAECASGGIDRPVAVRHGFDSLRYGNPREPSDVLLEVHILVPIDDLRVVERRAGATTLARVEERQRELVRKRLMSTSDLLHAEGLRAEGTAGDG